VLAEYARHYISHRPQLALRQESPQRQFGRVDVTAPREARLTRQPGAMPPKRIRQTKLYVEIRTKIISELS
jgi:hypothetical protein